MTIPKHDLNKLIKEIWKVLISMAGKQYKTPWKWDNYGQYRSTKIGWHESKKIKSLMKTLNENLYGDFYNYMFEDKKGFLIFNLEKIEKINCLKQIMWTSLTAWLKEWDSKTWSHLKIKD